MRSSILGKYLGLGTWLLASCGSPTPATEGPAVAPQGKTAQRVPPSPITPPANSLPPASANPDPGPDLDGPTRRMQESTLKDHTWFAELSRLKTPAHAPAELLGGQADEAWANLGYTRLNAQTYVQRAPLLQTVGDHGLVPTHSDALLWVDAVAVITIDRDNGQEPYLYKTLASIFATFPDDTQVNVLVGDARADFARPEILRQRLTAQQVERVHVWPTDPRTHDFLHENFSAERRGGWNYARALRSYTGERGLVLMEDDVRWSKDALADINRLLPDSPLATTFYNIDCYGPDKVDYTKLLRPFVHPVRVRDFKFVGTQGMYIKAVLANRLGEHIQRRIHERGWDFTMQLLFQQEDLMLGYMLPSLVQHTGKRSAGITPYFHETPCFADDVLP